MSEETLLTAARRAVRFFHIDQAHGGLVSIETIKAVETLDIQVARAAEAAARAADLAPAAHETVGERA